MVFSFHSSGVLLVGKTVRFNFSLAQCILRQSLQLNNNKNNTQMDYPLSSAS